VIPVAAVVVNPAVPSETVESETPTTWNPALEAGTVNVPTIGAVVPQTPVAAVPGVIAGEDAPLNVAGETNRLAAVLNPYIDTVVPGAPDVGVR